MIERRECLCGREFEVDAEFAKPWTVCPDCMASGGPIEPRDDEPLLAALQPGCIIPRSAIPDGVIRGVLDDIDSGVYVAPAIGVNFVEPWEITG